MFSVSVVKLYVILLLGIIVLAPIIYCSYWQIRSESKKQWIWTMFILLQTVANIWFVACPNIYSTIFLGIVLLVWLISVFVHIRRTSIAIGLFAMLASIFVHDEKA
jgi:K+-sensing histidine kinase KdpD